MSNALQKLLSKCSRLGRPLLHEVELPGVMTWLVDWVIKGHVGVGVGVGVAVGAGLGVIVGVGVGDAVGVALGVGVGTGARYAFCTSPVALTEPLS